MTRTFVLALALAAVVGLGIQMTSSYEVSANAAANAKDDVKVIEVTAANWKTEVEDSKIPVLVDFYADWCGPCRRLAPHVHQAAQDYKGKLKVVKVNTDNSPGLASKYGVTSLPTLKIFDGGKAVDTSIGYLDYAGLKKFIDKNVK